MSSAAQGSKRSKIHLHFTLTKDGEMYECNLCKNKLKKQGDGCTSNLIGHLRRHHEAEYVEFEPTLVKSKKQTIDDLLEEEEPITRESFLEKLTKFVVSTDQPYNVVESPEFQDLISYISKDKHISELPGRTLMTDKVTEMYQKKKEEVYTLLQSTTSKISLAIDGWTSSNKFAFQGVVCRFVDENWKLITLPLDLTELHGVHSGENIAHSLLQVLREYKISHRIVSVTSDNASNMDTFFTHFQELLKQERVHFEEKHQRVRCLAHIINLSANALVEEAGKNVPLAKLRDGIRAIRTTPQRREAFWEHCESDAEKEIPILDCKTRWNSTYDMIQRALKIRQPLELTFDFELQEYNMNDEDWNSLNKLSEVLKPLKEATDMVSKEKTPCIANSTMVYQYLFTHFDSVLKENSSRSSGRAKKADCQWILPSVKAAKQKLEKYYPDSGGRAHVIGTVLHPGFKMQWFEKVGWCKDWIEEYKSIIQSEWEKNYKRSAVATTESPSAGSSEGNDFFGKMYQEQMQSHLNVDELNRFLSMPIVDKKILKSTGLLGWWKVHEIEYPSLSQMAKDYLNVAGSGVPVESFFASATDILTDNRQRLSPAHLKQLLCLKKWLKCL